MSLPLLFLALTAPTFAAAAAANVDVTSEPENGGVAGRYLVEANGEISDIFLSKLEHARDPLISGIVTADLFARDSVACPVYAGQIRHKDKITINGENHHATLGRIVQHGFELLTGARGQAVRDAFDGGRLRPLVHPNGKRSLLACGPTASQSLAGGASGTFTLDLLEAFRPGRLVLPRLASGLAGGMSITAFTVNGVSIIDTTFPLPGAMFACDSGDSPVITLHLRAAGMDDVWVPGKHVIRITVKNNNTSTIRMAPCVTAI